MRHRPSLLKQYIEPALQEAHILRRLLSTSIEHLSTVACHCPNPGLQQITTMPEALAAVCHRCEAKAKAEGRPSRPKSSDSKVSYFTSTGSVRPVGGGNAPSFPITMKDFSTVDSPCAKHAKKHKDATRTVGTALVRKEGNQSNTFDVLAKDTAETLRLEKEHKARVKDREAAKSKKSSSEKLPLSSLLTSPFKTSKHGKEKEKRRSVPSAAESSSNSKGKGKAIVFADEVDPAEDLGIAMNALDTNDSGIAEEADQAEQADEAENRDAAEIADVAEIPDAAETPDAVEILDAADEPDALENDDAPEIQGKVKKRVKEVDVSEAKQADEIKASEEAIASSRARASSGSTKAPIKSSTSDENGASSRSTKASSKSSASEKSKASSGSTKATSKSGASDSSKKTESAKDEAKGDEADTAK